MRDLNQLIDMLEEKRLFLMDGDGTLYIGNRPTEGAKEFLTFLDNNGKNYIIVTNNSSYSRKEHAARISKILRHRISIDKVLVSTQVTVRYLKENGVVTVYALGVPSFKRELLASHIKLSSINPQMVVVAFDKTLTYGKIACAARLIRKGTPYIVTHPDVVCPTEKGYIPDAGSILAMIRAATNVDPIVIIGKPNRLMLDYILDTTGFELKDTVLFGDRLYTDIKMAVEANIRSVLVLTGEAGYNSKKMKYRPDFIVTSLKSLIPFLS